MDINAFLSPSVTGASTPQSTVTASQPAAVLRCRLAETDPELAAALDGELVRQQDGIELIARENAVSARSSWRRKDRC